MGSRRPVLLIALAIGAALLVVSTTAADLYTGQLSAEEASGPEQPISFSHARHAGELKIECLYCHGPAEQGQEAGIPAVSVCMGCHQHVSRGSTPGSEQEIAKLRDYYARGEPIPWQRIHTLPEHVQFKHHKHVQAGVACQTCHGPVQDMKRVYLAEETRYTSRSLWLPTAKLEMGWCMECHLERSASDDCVACHH
jgi:hypothetical protein